MSTLTSSSIASFVETVSQQNHAMAGAVIAASAAQAVGLGQACMQISLDEQDLPGERMAQRIARLDLIKEKLLEWCDRDANAIAKFVALREAGKALAGQQLLCRAPAEVARISIEAASIMQAFRPYVSERVRDDLEMSISLLSGSARAALLLLDSNLRIWEKERPLLDEFEPVLAGLFAAVDDLDPQKRIRREKREGLGDPTKGGGHGFDTD